MDRYTVAEGSMDCEESKFLKIKEKNRKANLKQLFIGVLTQVQKFFNINDAEAGLLQTVFILFFMIFAPFFGFIGDRYNRKRIMAAGIAIWVIAVFASSFVPRNCFWLFLLLRGIIGIGEASYATTAPTIIADIFISVVRGRVLMFFYFAIPIGSGLGYMVGSFLASVFNDWAWGIRLTPILGIICLFLIMYFIDEPQRGQAEKAEGALTATEIEITSYMDDLKALSKIPTFICATIGYTAVIFAVGTLSWWAPTAIQHSYAMQKGLNSTNLLDSREKDRITFVFGVLTMAGGIIGVSLGTALSQMLLQGSLCLQRCQTFRANALICALGSVLGTPFLYLGLHLIEINMTASWTFIFFTVTSLCLNWSINVEMLLDVVTPTRRGTANSWQILISHLLGDASGPYIVGLISDLLRHSASGPAENFRSLITAFYLPNFVLVVSAVFFGLAAVFFIRDKRIFEKQMGKFK
ncbi:unnamed protein product [Dracunculus medinensis]|uniref:MFS domain-containing protein n=1 Tax=Dracunculus medinensis TaxID=318479 RepID=A0A0N4U0D4_DRAME|nr:unnamed protein product [Dracunculus medinensis]